MVMPFYELWPRLQAAFSGRRGDVYPALAAALSPTRHLCDHDFGTRRPHPARHDHHRGLKEAPCRMPLALLRAHRRYPTPTPPRTASSQPPPICDIAVSAGLTVNAPWPPSRTPLGHTVTSPPASRFPPEAPPGLFPQRRDPIYAPDEESPA
jgi:hypothetical protein